MSVCGLYRRKTIALAVDLEIWSVCQTGFCDAVIGHKSHSDIQCVLISQHTEKGRARTTLKQVPLSWDCMPGRAASESSFEPLVVKFTEVKERNPLPEVAGQNHPKRTLGLGKVNNSRKASWQAWPCKNISRGAPGGSSLSSGTSPWAYF